MGYAVEDFYSVSRLRFFGNSKVFEWVLKLLIYCVKFQPNLIGIVFAGMQDWFVRVRIGPQVLQRTVSLHA